MDRNDSQAIEQLFGKLAAVEQQSAPRDAEAETFIRERVARQPGAPYYMAQTIVVQEQALEAAQARIEQLEAQTAEAPRQSGGLFGGLFGDSRPPARSGSVPRVGRPGGAAPQQPVPAGAQAQRGGGGFLAGAAQTAMGVAGGLLLGNAIAGMLGGGGEAQAADAGADDPQVEDAGFDGGGVDFGDMDF
ncbi:DUF2076 family protein [Mesorhizobium sp. CAU 1732]|uniref:DUF2076 domain-containing protein n=1 Tax=Mesorhizobium sp. CAU 1732 TaxID=3140358 RepID=UPI0032609993